MSDATTKPGQDGWRVKLDPTVNLGHMITATVFLVTAAMGWATLDAKQARTEERVVRLERLEEELRRERMRDGERIGALTESINSVKHLLEQMDRRITLVLTQNRRAELDGRP